MNAWNSHRHLIWDNVVPLAPTVGNGIDLLDRYHAAGHSFVSLTIAGDDCDLSEAMHRLAGARAAISTRAERLTIATDVAAILAAHSEGKLAVGLHLEGTGCLERDPDMLDIFYALGIRHAILAFNQNNAAAGGCADIGDAGLSRLGRRYLDRMRALGMLLDASHMSERASLEAIEFLGVPVVFTHSNARAVHDHYRNISDQQARAAAASGGLVGISGSSIYIGGSGSLVEGTFRHLDYLVALVGPDHVGLGTDYIVDAEAVVRYFAQHPDEWPADNWSDRSDVAYLPPEGLSDVVALMRGAGYDEPVIGKILGGNYVRIAREVWR